jgi:hypothetical protein
MTSPRMRNLAAHFRAAGFAPALGANEFIKQTWIDSAVVRYSSLGYSSPKAAALAERTYQEMRSRVDSFK